MFQSILTLVIEQLPAVFSADVDHLDLLDTVCWSIDFLMIFFTVHCTTEESFSKALSIQSENVLFLFLTNQMFIMSLFVKKKDQIYSHARSGAHLTSTNTPRRKLNCWILIRSRLVANQWRAALLAYHADVSTAHEY